MLTGQDVIRVLLRKFRVADNPHKYALYERQDDFRGERCEFFLKEERLGFAICQFSKKQILVSSETAAAAGGNVIAPSSNSLEDHKFRFVRVLYHLTITVYFPKSLFSSKI